MNIVWQSNQFQSTSIPTTVFNSFKPSNLEQVLNFQSTLPNYSQTPLYHLDNLAKHLGVASIDVKDESKRFDLNAFKGLGGAYAMASYFAQKLNLDLGNITFNKLMEVIKDLEPVTFATVTAGNHGKGVAWAAKTFGQKVKVVLPKGASVERLTAIQDLGAEAYISDLNYDDAVVEIAKQSDEQGWILLQDTAWVDYETLPLAIMQGYSTIVAELIKQLDRKHISQYTHVILQAGVGSFAAAVIASIYNQTVPDPPKFIIVEPNKADCIFTSIKSNDGIPKRVNGPLDSMMAGLACGEPSTIAWEILKPTIQATFSCKDVISSIGMKQYANPLNNDRSIISGESGALPLGVLIEIMTSKELFNAKDSLKLDNSSNILLINTEGNTNPKNYDDIIHNKLF